MGGGRGLGSMSETEASQPHLKSERASVTIRSGIPRLTLGITRQAGFPDSSWQRLLGIRHGIGGDGNDRGWHTGLFHRLDVSADVLGQIQTTGADFL